LLLGLLIRKQKSLTQSQTLMHEEEKNQ
jgi:hypothetical protein